MPFDINMRKAIALAGSARYHRQGYYGQGINIAVIDSGISPHPEFEDRIRWDISRNFCLSCTDKNNLFDESGLGHGTAVASLIIGKNIGIAPHATVTSLKVINGMAETEEASIINALTHVRDNPSLFDVVNMSMGWSLSQMSASFNKKAESLINQIVSMGIPFICAAGNTGKEQFLYPASYHDVISVGAADIEKKAAWFTTMNEEVDLCQIGVDVTIANLAGDYHTGSGTSFACPIVAGIAALLLCKYKSKFGRRMPEPELFAQLLANTVDIGINGIDKETGAGFCTLGNGSRLTMKVGSFDYDLNGSLTTKDVAPVIINSRTMVPARFVSEPFGQEAFWTGPDTIDIIG